MRMTDLPPALVLLLGALILPLVRGKWRWVVALALPMLALAESWAIITEGLEHHVTFMGMTLNHVHVHAPTPVFATVTCITVAVGMLFALKSARVSELCGACVYGGGALGCMFAGDLITLFIFWEIMTLGSTTMIWSGNQKDSESAGIRYFALHAVGGVLLLIGIVLLVAQRMGAGDPNPLAFGHFTDMVQGWSTLGWHNAPLWLILVGMLINAGAPPFSSWIPDAYPEASPSGSVFLSAFTTKTAVFALMVGFAGTEVLIYIGLYMALYGVMYGILENDMRRLLCYSLVNQVGFMLIGIGVGTNLALDGAAGHAFSHIIYKALLLMATGAVLFQTGKRKLNQLGGLWHTMPVTMWCCVIGGLSISGFPLTSGFTSKSMVVEAIQQEASRMAGAGIPHTYLIVTWFLFQAATAGVFLDACVKLTWFVFLQKDSGLRPPEAPWNMRAAMVVFAGICIFLGMFPGVLYDILPYRAEAAAYLPKIYTFEHVMTMLGLLSFSGLAFFVLLPLLKRTETVTLDLDWIWRRFIPKVWKEVLMPIIQGLDNVQKTLLEKLPGKPMGEPRSQLARLGTEWAVSVPVFVVTLMLVVYLVVYFVILPTA